MTANQKLTPLLMNRTVSGVRQADDEIAIDFSDGSTLTIKLAEPTSSVMLRDKDKKMEYAD
jgi:hypothetical protein